MTTFQSRLEQADSLVELLRDGYWSNPAIRQGHGFLHAGYGYETHVPEEMRSLLIERDDPTARAIRFKPDFLVTQSAGTRQEVILLEYKTTTTPRYNLGERQWDIGQLEADPLEYYLHLAREGNRLAVLIYCSYHPHPLLCDYPTEEWMRQGRRRVGSAGTGSGTDYYNMDLRPIRSFPRFMSEEFGVPEGTSNPLLRRVLEMIRAHPRLQTRHAGRSPYYNDPNYRTGFNWQIP